MTEQRTHLRRQADRDLAQLIADTTPVRWEATTDTGHTFQFWGLPSHEPQPGVTIRRLDTPEDVRP